MVATMEDLEKLIETVLFTGYLDDDDPVSLFIIAKPERGKTTSISKYITNKGVQYFTQATAWGIADAILPDLQRGINVHHLVIPDFLNCVLTSKSTSDKLIMFLNSLTEEGISNIASYANRGLPKNHNGNTFVKCGIITCITKDEYEKRKKRWTSLGFLSRFLPIQYEYSSGYVNEIFDKIKNNNQDINEKINLNFPDNKKHIIIEDKYIKEFELYCKLIGTSIDVLGIRLLIIFRSLLKANALRNKRLIVNQTDVEDVKRYIEFIKYDNRKPITIEKS